MSHLDALMVAEAAETGRGRRISTLCHRRLAPEPMAVVLWQLGAEPFSAAALGWGTSEGSMRSAVAGDPRNRTLAFRALLEFARQFNPWFEAPAQVTETISRRRGDDIVVATDAPQVMVANAATLALLGRLGRRLAYLPTDGDDPADPALVRLGRHLQFLHEYAHMPGQQLVIVLTELVGGNWASGQTALERQSLSALDAYIDPPDGVHGFRAAAAAERVPVGPLPGGDDDERLEPLVTRLNEARDGGTDPAVVAPFLEPIAVHYASLLAGTWRLVWRCFWREAGYPEAPSCERRFFDDRREYSSHIEWVVTRGGRRRTRKTARQAVRYLARLEGAQERLLAEEALDDPLRLIPYLLDGKALQGVVRLIDRDYMEVAKVKRVRRPLVVLDCDEPCRLPVGKKLYWTGDAGGPEWTIHAVRNAGDRSQVTMKLMTSSPHDMPPLDEAACFSVLTSKPPYVKLLPREDPWTHRAASVTPSSDLEESGGAP